MQGKNTSWIEWPLHSVDGGVFVWCL